MKTGKKDILFIVVIVLFLSVTLYIISKKIKPMYKPFEYQSNLSSTQKINRWVSFITPHAKVVGKKYGLPWEALVAQTGWETGWGKSSLLHEAFNIAGIKAVGNQPYVVKRTHEYENGVKIWKDAKFRKWDTFQEGLEGYAEFFHKYSRYRHALNYPNDPYKFIEEIRKAGYATSINYITNLHGVLDKYVVGKNIPEYSFEGNNILTLQQGSRGSDVKELQSTLNNHLLDNKIYRISEDGIFGKRTMYLLKVLTGKTETTLSELKERFSHDKACILCGKHI